VGLTARIPGYSDVDMAAIRALTACHIETDKAIQELVRIIAAEEGIELGK
jgi:hypothetical protein